MSDINTEMIADWFLCLCSTVGNKINASDLDQSALLYTFPHHNETWTFDHWIECYSIDINIWDLFPVVLITDRNLC